MLCMVCRPLFFSSFAAVDPSLVISRRGGRCESEMGIGRKVWCVEHCSDDCYLTKIRKKSTVVLRRWLGLFDVTFEEESSFYLNSLVSIEQQSGGEQMIARTRGGC